MKKTRINGLLALTLMVSLALHGILYVWGQRFSGAPLKRLVAIQLLEKKQPPKVPNRPKVKPIPRKSAKGLRPSLKRTGAKPAGMPKTPQKFGVSKGNTVGEMALPEGNTLVADPLATPEPISTAAPQEERETYYASGDCDSPPVPKTEIQAVYPDFAKIGHLDGKVILELDIASDGKIVDIRVLKSPHDCLSQAAIDAIRGIRFSPAIKDGGAVAVTMRYPFSFSLTP